MSHPLTRVLALLELLQARPGIGGAELARRLDVDERTVRRYAARLAALGVPVVADRGRYGGYRLAPGYKLPPLMLTDDEAVAVVLGLLAARRLGLPGDAAAAALAKVQRVLPAALRDRVQALEQTLAFTLAERDGTAPATAALLTLAAAARDRRRTRIRYRSWRGGDSERDLDPHGLVLHSGRWYVTGHDHRSGQIRTFRVDRIASAEPRPETFTVPDGTDPAAHLTASLAAVPYPHLVRVRLETTLAQARRRIPATLGVLTEDGGGVLLEARVQSLEGMAVMLAGLGWPFVVCEPDELRRHIRDLADTLRAQADRTP
ncbi:helix-turn-helix transcriptional regulator [Thermomonospora cellulosilytica]|uniref:Putative DNA-binding transcriptional regulator YafY n=1 Tax=Thermomonospora cellulosilytica TaxID=1411118 RepID=A0A7W3RAB6_9ACTN|nr:YafY family protein [Thermomonospora cellulosilytica]MBA9005687.1 putative DNA-binding transcriptional regulator YafY [Thermomonospora cellulosilytica]